MRISLIATLAALLAGCATAVSGPPGVGEGYEPSTLPTSQTPYPPVAQVMVIPPTRTVPLPQRTPPAIVQSRLEAMVDAEAARWALPEHAERIVRVEFARAWLPVIHYGGFFERPSASGAPGVCQVFVHGVNFRPYRENELTYQQHLDPPLEPYQVTDEYRYRVLGSSLSGDAATQAACDAATPYLDWFQAPSDQAVFWAVGAVQRAAVYPREYVITCAGERADAGGAVERYACDGPAMLKRFAPHLIKRVQGVPCDPAFVFGSTPCFEVTYDSPEAPGTSSQYVVRTGAKRIAIQHVMLPPM